MKRAVFLLLLLLAAVSAQAEQIVKRCYVFSSHACTVTRTNSASDKISVPYSLDAKSNVSGGYCQSSEVEMGMSSVTLSETRDWLTADQPVDADGEPKTRLFCGWWTNDGDWGMEQPKITDARALITLDNSISYAMITNDAATYSNYKVPVIIAQYVSLWDISTSVVPDNAGTVSGGGRFEDGDDATLTATAANGYSFEKWADGATENPRKIEHVSSDATYTAVFTGNVYTVTLDANGGAGGTEKVEATFGAAMPALTAFPTRKGYEFGGYSDSKGTLYYNADGTGARPWDKANTETLKANWSPADAKLYIFFSPHITAIKHRAGESLEWITSTEETHYIYPNGTKYEAYAETEEGWIADFRETNTKKGTVDYEKVEFRPVASEVIVTYRVAFHDPSGTYGDLVSPAVAKGTTMTPPNWAKTGYVLSWDPEIGPLMSNTTYTAVWTPQLYTVAFEANGGSETMTNVFFLRDTPSTLPSNRYVRTGYRFDCWTTNGVPAFEDGATNLVNLAAVGETLALTAAWTANRYTVVFAPNPPAGATATGAMQPQEFVYDKPQALTDNAFGCGELWAFNGWSNTVSGALYADGEPVSNLTSVADGEVRLNALWKNDAGVLSNAMMANPNLKWTDANEGWVAGQDCDGNACGAHVGSQPNGATMSANITSSGTLTFHWQPCEEGEQLLITLNGVSEGQTFTGEQDIVFQVPSGTTKVSIKNNNVNTYMGMSDCESYISGMVWTPAGGGEPTPGAMVKPSAAGVADGVFSLTIPTTGGAAEYGVWTNADLTVPVGEWGLMEKKEAKGAPLDFVLPISGMPKLFFSAHEVEYR